MGNAFQKATIILIYWTNSTAEKPQNKSATRLRAQKVTGKI